MQIKKSYYLSFALGLIALVLAIILIITQLSKNENSYDASSVMTRIDKLQELALVKFNYAGVIGFDESLKLLDINLPFTSKYFLLKYNGYVKAGIELKETKITVNKDVIDVLLPEPKIFETYINEKSIHVYNQSENIFNPLKIEDYNRAIISEKDKIRKEAINEGILNTATEQAHLVISSLLADMQFKKINIKNNDGVEIKRKVD